MRLRLFAPLCALAALLSGPSQAAFYSGKQVGEVHVDNRPCIFFQLKGVGEADPVTPAIPWFALPTGDANYQTYVSLILSAKISGQPVFVSTDGTTSCGHATITIAGLN